MKNTFSDTDKQKAMAIVRVFETGKPLGDYAAVAVLNDGAGVSFGASQFTHRSGSLRAVIDEYLRLGGIVGRRVLLEKYRVLRTISPDAIGRLSTDDAFKNALRSAAVTREMRAAQDMIAERKYLQPAIDACEGSGFVLPLSLAVIYDSMTHGSYEKIRDKVRASKSDGFSRSPDGTPKGVTLTSFEKAWITEYVRTRDAWLGSIPRLRATRYRTRFFLDQIKVGRWHLELPLTVHGVRLTEIQSTGFSLPLADNNQPVVSTMTNLKHSAHAPLDRQAESSALNPESRNAGSDSRNAGTLARIEQHVDSAADTFDQIERIATAVITRTDRGKSLWTAVTGTLFQTAWAVFSFAAGLPREVWFFAAGVAAALTLMYLYRQITLGRIRERRNAGTLPASFSKD
jgi:chitosanase